MDRGCQYSFYSTEASINFSPILGLPDFTLPFVLETDASGYGLGAVLLQNEHPIAYFSKILGPRPRLKSIYEKELMAIVLAVQKWRHYLVGHPFLIRTDQQSLKFLLEQRKTGSEYQRWVSKLLEYNFTIVYKPGHTNNAADSLSRAFDTPVELCNLITTGGVSWSVFKEAIDKDEFLQKLKTDLEQKKIPVKGFELIQGVVRYKGRIVIPPQSQLVGKLLKEYHDSPVGGHSGEFKTYKREALEWFCPGMQKDIAKHIRECQTCQQQKQSTLKPAGVLQPLPVPSRIWEDISLDFVEGLPKSQGMDTILVVVDRLSKYAHFIGLSHPFLAPTVVMAFIKEIVRLHGFPSCIVSDRDRIFISLFWQELFRVQGTALLRSTAYHHKRMAKQR